MVPGPRFRPPSGALTHVDNAYWIPHFRAVGYSCRTNRQSNTAFRGFGGPQGVLVMEDAIDRIAHHLGRDAHAIRALHDLNWVTGQVLDCDGGLALHSPIDSYGEAQRNDD